MVGRGEGWIYNRYRVFLTNPHHQKVMGGTQIR